MLRFPSINRIGSICTVLMILWTTTASAQTTKKFNPEETRRRMEEVRRKMELKRREMERNRTSTSSKSSSFKRSTSLRKPSTRPKFQSTAPRYQFKTGQQFGYALIMDWVDKGRANRVMGMPYYQVRNTAEYKSTMLAIGHFRHLIKSSDDGEYREISGRDYWMPSIQMVGRDSIEWYGNKPDGGLTLPYLMHEFVNIPMMVFPGLPKVMDRRLGSEQSAVVTVTRGKETLWEGFTKANGSAGRVSRYRTAKSTGSTLQFDDDDQFVQGELKATFKSKTVFDVGAGSVRSCKGTYEITSRGKTTKVSITLQRLTGSQLEAAKKSAMAELGKMPKSLLPVKLARKPVELKFPKSYTAETLPPVGTSVAYYDREMRQRYQVVFEKKYSSTKVKIRFAGSGETLTVRPSQLMSLTESTQQANRSQS